MDDVYVDWVVLNIQMVSDCCVLPSFSVVSYQRMFCLQGHLYRS